MTTPGTAWMRLAACASGIFAPRSPSRHSSADWVDPVIAVRLRSQLAPRWSSLLYADVGGFGVGARSTWQVMGSIKYALKDNVHLSLGYRHLAVDYRKNGMLLNIQQGGPLLGATWQF